MKPNRKNPTEDKAVPPKILTAKVKYPTTSKEAWAHAARYQHGNHAKHRAAMERIASNLERQEKERSRESGTQ